MINASDVDLIPEKVTEKELLEALEGRLPQIRPVAAFKELQQRKSPRIAHLTLRVLEDRKLPADLRSSAAVALGKEAKAENRQALAAAIDPQDSETLKHIARSLGQIGDEASLRALEALEIPPDDPAWRSLRFARVLIAYRHGLDSHTLEPILPGQVLEFNCQKPRPVKTRTIASKALKEMLPSLQELLPAFPISEIVAIHLDCDGVEFLLVFNREALKKAKAASELGRNKAVAGALLKKSEGLDAYFVHEYLLMNPTGQDGKAPLFGVRSTGVSLHSGVITYSPEGAEFHLAALNTSHAPPLQLSGKYDLKSGRVSIERAETCPERAPLQRTPRTPTKD